MNPSLADLSDTLGPTMAREVVRVYLQTFPTMLYELGHNDRDRCRRAAHGLKSSSRQMGATGLADLMAGLERRLQTPEHKVTPADLTAIAVEFSTMVGPLRAFATGRK